MLGPVMAIDPGYRTVGWCLFREGPAPPDAPAVLHRLQEYGRLQLRAERLPERLDEIRGQLSELMFRLLPAMVAVELPAIAGSYARHKGRKAEEGVQSMLFATGVIIAVATQQRGAHRVRTMKAPAGKWAKKENRHEWLRAQFALAQVPIPQGVRGGELPDVLDAVWLGVQVLRTPELEVSA